MKAYKWSKAWWVCLLLTFSIKANAGWPTFPHAPGMESKWIADQLVYNGVPMWVEEFSCICRPEKVLDYYRRRWGRLKHGFVESEFRGFQQINRGEEGFFFSVQIKEKNNGEGESEGRLSITVVPPKGSESPVLGSGIPQPDFTSVLNDVQDAVPGKRIRTLALYNDIDMMTNTNFYRTHFAERGWKSMLQTVSPKQGSQALSFTRKNKDVNIVIYTGQNGQSNILYNEVEIVR